MVPETASLRVTELSTSLDKIMRVVSLLRLSGEIISLFNAMTESWVFSAIFRQLED